MLAPSSCQKILSYIAGWATVCAWQAAVSAICLPLATIVQGLVIMNNPAYPAARWHATLMTYAFILLALFVNTYLNKHFAKIEGIILILYVIGFFGVVISLSALSIHVSADQVFKAWNNSGGWSSMGLSWFVSLSSFAGAFAGADGATHMAEEIHNASIIVPRSMVTSVLINGVFGFAALMAILFSLSDLENALLTPTGYPFMYIFQSAAGIKGGTVMACTIVCLGTFGSWALLATASRQIWAFSRDNGLPGSRFLSRVSYCPPNFDCVLNFAPGGTQHCPSSLRDSAYDRHQLPYSAHLHRLPNWFQRGNLPARQQLLPVIHPPMLSSSVAPLERIHQAAGS